MLLCKYFEEIESLEFQIQFSVVGGIEILHLAMERHPTLVALRSEIANNEDLADAVFHRIVLLLGKVETETNLSYDESIAAYLFCLFKEKPISAYRASWRILDFGGLWWSVQLALYVKDFVKQLTDSINFSSTLSEPIAYTMSDRIHHSIKNTFLMILKSEAFEIRAEIKDRQLRHLSSFGEVSPESDDKEDLQANSTLSYSIALAHEVELSVVD